MSMRFGWCRWDTPCAGREPKSARWCCLLSAGTVVIRELDVLVERVPLLLPSPDRTAVNAAFIGNDHKRELLADKQPQRNCSRFGEVRIGRIGHSRPPFVIIGSNYSLGRPAFMLQRW